MIVGWIIFSFVVGFVGSGRKIGFLGAFFLSLILSPVIGLIIALVSKDKEDEAYKKKILQAQKSQQETLNYLSYSKQRKSSTNSLADELKKLKKLREENMISEDEFIKLRNKVINS